MPTRVFIDGEIGDERSAVVPVFDRGFLYGDGIYEVTRTAGGRPVDLDRHLDRLERSSAAIALSAPPRAEIARAVVATLAEARNPESYIRIVVTRGGGEIGLDPALADRPRLVVIVKPLLLPARALYADGVDIALVQIRRNLRRALDPAVKSGNYLNNILALAEARRSDAYEGVMCNADGRVVEGSTSNVFLVRRGTVVTPDLEDGLLAGIARGRVLEICAALDVAAVEEHVLPDQVRRADEVFLTSSLRGVLPVASVDGVRLGGPVPGPITGKVLGAYERFLGRVAAGEL